MFSIDRWQEIFDAMSKNKLRTVLTGISVGSGIFILVILLGVANGLRKGIKKKMEVDSTNKIEFWARKTSKPYKGLSKGRTVKLSLKDYDYISETYKEQLEYKSPIFKRNWLKTVYKGETGNYRIFGVLPDHQFISNVALIKGRFISQKDQDQLLKVAVIGLQVIEDLKIDIEKVLGTYIEIKKVKYKVIGVYNDPGGQWQNNMIYLPHSTFSGIFNSVKDAGYFSFTLKEELDYETALVQSEIFSENVMKKLKREHQVHPDDELAIKFFNRITGSKDIYQLNTGLHYFFWGIGLLTLIAGIVGISNIMLIVVKERTKEIGIRKALGAQPKAIIAMILHESIFITALSGLMGMFFGLVCLEIVGKLIQTDFILNPSIEFNVAIIMVCLLVIAGAFAGYIPAKYAAKVKPIIALRDE